jgi:hypothetical protein
MATKKSTAARTAAKIDPATRRAIRDEIARALDLRASIALELDAIVNAAGIGAFYVPVRHIKAITERLRHRVK